MSELSNKGMLVDLSISLWTGRKADNAVSAEIAVAHHAKDAGTFWKCLLDPKVLKPVINHAQLTRLQFYEKTLPWLDSGARVLPSRSYFDFMEWTNQRVNEFNALVQTLLDSYNAEVHAAKLRLNGLFQNSDYPTSKQLAMKFEMSFQIFPIPQAGDFRLDLSDFAKEKLELELTRSYEKARKDFTVNLLNRVTPLVSHMAERLNDTDATFRDSLVHNIKSLNKTLSDLNLHDDPDVEAIRSALDALIVEPETLRENKIVRAGVAQHAVNIVESVEEIMARMAAY